MIYSAATTITSITQIQKLMGVMFSELFQIRDRVSGVFVQEL